MVALALCAPIGLAGAYLAISQNGETSHPVNLYTPTTTIGHPGPGSIQRVSPQPPGHPSFRVLLSHASSIPPTKQQVIPPAATVQSMVKRASQSMARVVSTFPGPATGITGVVYKTFGPQGNVYGVAWVFKHPAIIALGHLVLPNGHAITVPTDFSPQSPLHSKPQAGARQTPISPEVAVTASAASVGNSVAAPTAQNPESAAIAMVQTASHGTAWAVSTFTGPTPGVTGVIYKTQGPKTVIFGVAWVFQHPAMMVLGHLVLPSGNAMIGTTDFSLQALRNPLNFTPPATGNHPTSPTASAAVSSTTSVVPLPAHALTTQKQSAGLSSALDTTYVATTGRGGPKITVFFDPNSLQAWHFYQSTLPMVQHSQLRIAWAPVALSGRNALQRGEYILSAPVPGIAVRQNFKHFHPKGHIGGGRLLSNLTMMEAVDANTQVLTRINEPVNLSVYYCDQKSSSPVGIFHPVSIKTLTRLLPTIGTDCP